MSKNPVAKQVRTPKFKSQTIPNKKKYNRKKREVVGYYYDYDGKETILYKDDK